MLLCKSYDYDYDTKDYNKLRLEEKTLLVTALKYGLAKMFNSDIFTDDELANVSYIYNTEVSDLRRLEKQFEERFGDSDES